MFEFYKLSQAVILVLIMLSSLCVAAQALAVVFTFNRHKTTIIQWLENILEVCMLIHSLLLSLLISRVMSDIHQLLVSPQEYIALRYAGFIVVAVLALTIGILRRRMSAALEVIPLVALVIPISESIFSTAFPWVYTIALLLFMVRAFTICIRRQRVLRREVSAFSIKEALDALHTGLLYCTTNGEIYLINRKMQTLMYALTGRMWRNGLDFRAALQNGASLSVSDMAVLDDKRVYRLADGTVWLFSEDELLIGSRLYIQVSAFDVSERWALTDELQAQREALLQRGDELAKTLENLDKIRREDELQKLKSRVHDTMAQRLTILMRVFRAKMTIDEADLMTYADDMLAEVRKDADDVSSIETLCRVYGEIGVEIKIIGAEPIKAALAEFYTAFVRECLTNAVRHGLATDIRVVCETTAREISISVINDGVSSKAGIQEGGGITELRRRISALNGTISIATQPKFTIIARIPMTDDGGTL